MSTEQAADDRADNRPDSTAGDARRITSVAAPLYLSMIAVSLSALVNTAVLGRFDTAALAGFAVTGAVYFPAMAAVSGAVRGVMPFVSAKADDRPGLLEVTRNGTWLAVIVGVLGALAVAGVPLLAEATGVPARTVDSLGAFPWLMAGCVLVNGFGSMATSTLVGLSRSRIVMRAGLASAITTMALSVVLVAGPGPLPALGLAGSGLALLISNVVVAVVAILGLRSHLGERYADLVGTRFRPREVLALAKVGIPMAATVLIKFAVLGVLALAAARVSTEAAAVHNIGTVLVGLTFNVAVAIGQATIPVVSGHAAKGDMARARRGVGAGLIVNLAVLGVLCVLLVVLSPLVVPLFTEDPAVVPVAEALMPLVALAVLFDGIQAVMGFGLIGLKRTVPSLIVFAVLYGLLAVVSIPIAASAGVSGLWTTLAVANVLLAIGQGTAFRLVSARMATVNEEAR